MSFEALFGPVTVVVEKLLAGLDVSPRHEDEPGLFPEHDDLGLKVGGKPGVVDETSKAPGFRCGVDTETVRKLLVQVKKKHFSYSSTFLERLGFIFNFTCYC